MAKRRSSSQHGPSAGSSDLVRIFTGLPTAVQMLVLMGAIVFGLVLVLNPGLLNPPPAAAPTPQPTSTDSPAASVPGVSPSDVDVRYPAMPQGLTRVEIVRVVDGDTARINLNGVQETVRLIGLNTPETVAPNRPVECFGAEASRRAHELLDGQFMYFETDDTQDTRDRYGRLLGYLWSEDGRLFNMQMIVEGYAYEYTYNVPYKYQSQFKAAQREAEAGERGLWSPSTCSGQR